jgi:hypothetical protein
MRYVVFHPHGLIDINNRSKYQLMVSVFIVDKIIEAIRSHFAISPGIFIGF